MTDCIQRKLHNLSPLIKNKNTLTLFNKKVFIKILIYIQSKYNKRHLYKQKKGDITFVLLTLILDKSIIQNQFIYYYKEFISCF